MFDRQGDNLYTTQQITLIEALVGFEKTLKHLDDSVITLKREGITQYGFVQTIKGSGMPHFDNPSQHGDLFVEYKVIFPTSIDKDTVECKYLTNNRKMMMAMGGRCSVWTLYHCLTSSCGIMLLIQCLLYNLQYLNKVHTSLLLN